MAEEIRYDADEANRLAARLETASESVNDSASEIYGVKVTGGWKDPHTKRINEALARSVAVIREDRTRYSQNMADYGKRLADATAHTSRFEESIQTQLQNKQNEIESFEVHEI